MSTATPRRRSPEPFLWLLFTAGGMAAALVLPALVLLFGLAFPLGLLDAPAVRLLTVTLLFGPAETKLE